MIVFAQPVLLALSVPVVILWWLFFRVQRRALVWIESHVATRFRSQFSRYTGGSLRLHSGLMLAIGLALTIAAAGPGLAGKGETEMTGGRLLLLVDASASMYAEDMGPIEIDRETPKNRLESARAVAAGVVSGLQGFQFALASFSGTAVIHLPMINDRRLLDDAIATLETHTYYRNTGSSLARALDLVSHFVDRRRDRLQVLLLSDGEQPFPEDYSDALAALAEQEVTIHAVALGSEEGQTRLIYDFQDVVAEKEEKTVLAEYTTRRVDEHLRRISSATGGRFEIARLEVVDEVVSAILEEGSRLKTVSHEDAERDLAGPLLLFALLSLLFDTLWLRRPQTPGDRLFDVRRLGRPPAVILAIAALLVSSCGTSPRGLAHRENERGIALDTLVQHRAARPHYERSIGIGMESHIPTYNLARSVALAGDHSEAHDLFQQALELSPELTPALFNDGVTFYRWGEAERDPKGCDLERTRELWIQAQGRFASVLEAVGPETELGRQARANLKFVSSQLARVERLIAEPPEACRSKQPAATGAGGTPAGGGQENGAGGNEDGGGEGGGSDNEGDDDAGSSGGAGPLTQEDLDGIRGQIEQLAAQGREEGKFHRRTRPEQWHEEDWANPDSEIWW